MKTLPYILALLFVTSSCSTLKDWGSKAMFWTDDEEEEQSKEGEKAAAQLHQEQDGEFVDGLTPREMELKQAKMWARMDEIQNELRMHRARIKVLEKGMKLGIVPDELLSGKYVAKPYKPSKITSDLSKPKKKTAETKKKMQQKKATRDRRGYKRVFTEGESYFRAGHYGKAIAAFEKVGRDYADHDPQNSHRFWVALSWYKLKDLQVAKDEFDGFIKTSADSPWLPRAKYYVAKIQFDMGLTQSSIKGFRDLIKSYPHDDTSEMAKMEIEKIERSL